MKKYFYFLSVILISYELNAQKITPSVIANAGGVTKNANFSLEWTFGEMMTETIKNGNSITQGFHQANLNVVAIDKIEIEGLNVFPNPVSYLLTLDNGSKENLALKILTPNGTELYRGVIQQGKEGMNLSNYPSGIYFFQFTNSGGTKTYKIEKQ